MRGRRMRMKVVQTDTLPLVCSRFCSHDLFVLQSTWRGDLGHLCLPHRIGPSDARRPTDSGSSAQTAQQRRAHGRQAPHLTRPLQQTEAASSIVLPHRRCTPASQIAGAIAERVKHAKKFGKLFNAQLRYILACNIVGGLGAAQSIDYTNLHRVTCALDKATLPGCISPAKHSKHSWLGRSHTTRSL